MTHFYTYLSTFVALAITTGAFASPAQQLPKDVAKITCQNHVHLQIVPSPKGQTTSSIRIPKSGVTSTYSNGEITLQETKTPLTKPVILEANQDHLQLECHDQCNITISNTANTKINLDMNDYCKAKIDGITKLHHVTQKDSSDLSGQWIDTRAFHHTMLDNATATIAGFVDFATFDIQNNASIDASEVEIKKAWVKSSDNGQIGLRPINQLFAYSGDSSHIYYINRAKLTELVEDSSESRILWINPAYLDKITL